MSELTDEYLELSRKYSKNPNQALICLEYAKFYSTDSKLKQQIENEIERLKVKESASVPKTAIVIISYNSKDIMIQCIESIRKHNPSNVYEIIVVDNHSEDGIVSWLSKQDDIKLICNDINVGFTAACNQGIAKAEKDADIFLLNNDTILFKNSLLYLQLGLYEHENTGAVGSVSNNIVGYQQIDETYQSFNEYEDYALKHNVFMKDPYEKKCWLVGYAMLIKKIALNRTGGLDECFSPGNFEDNDISIRLLMNGYHMLLCKNSFIYHYGSLSFKKDDQALKELLNTNYKKFVDKYGGIDYVLYSKRNMDLISEIKENVDNKFSLLEINCGLGADLAYLETIFPKANLFGIEENQEVANLAHQICKVECNSVEKFESKEFDYIIVNMNENLLTGKIEKIGNLLKSGGKLILGVDNSLLYTKLQKNKEFQTVYHNKDMCIEFLFNNFTANNVIQTLLKHQFSITDMNFARDYHVVLTSDEKNYLKSIWNEYNETYFQTKKYILKAIKN